MSDFAPALPSEGYVQQRLFSCSKLDAKDLSTGMGDCQNRLEVLMDAI